MRDLPERPGDVKIVVAGAIASKPRNGGEAWVRLSYVRGFRRLGLDVAFVEQAKADSFWQLLVLHGALGDGWRAELLSYEAPTYFGMLCAAYAPA